MNKKRWEAMKEDHEKKSVEVIVIIREFDCDREEFYGVCSSVEKARQRVREIEKEEPNFKDSFIFRHCKLDVDYDPYV